MSNKLALTPPMGWNSWNAFEQKIDEKLIRDTADAMVKSGMRDAGYKYLVLDDGWLQKERTSKGELIGDPTKFPNGMKAIGDYIHSKGLKFGIYEDRGIKTCQGLAGSYKHEAVDINTFASWGVDYLKLDSCFAEANKRLSSDDYTIYRDAIRKSGRQMILSISDFGNGAWAWGGENIGQLWRTSYDIYPNMDSIYYCAETSAGATVTHPAFNGLGQFAGPGHWNDADMLQVGNLKNDKQNRTHFALWAMLASPLMAGNDLRIMPNNVRDILTNRPVIAINQDARGIQGYRVVSNNGIEVYNKPLSDGTTAIMLLNKGNKTARISIPWTLIGLSGKQPVYDVWARRNLGLSDGGFTSEALEQHDHMLLRVGYKGAPLPGPEPLPLERYTVTRKGITQLSSLCYIWKSGNHATMDLTAERDVLILGGRYFRRGIGCKGKSNLLYKLAGKANRFRATIGLSQGNKPGAEGRFRVMEEDFFGNKVLFDSGKMRPESPAKTIDIDVSGKGCIMLEFTGDDVLGTWGDAHVVG